MRQPAFGFTLIELLIVIAIIGVLSAISIPSFSTFTTNQRLSQAAKQVKQDLRSAQNRAINNVDGKAWRIDFADSDARSYKSRKCDLVIDDVAETCAFTNCILVASKSFSTSFGFVAAKKIGFEQITGRVCGGTNGTTLVTTVTPASVILDLDGSQRTITVSAGGKIEEN